jgi:hypothetical protein
MAQGRLDSQKRLEDVRSGRRHRPTGFEHFCEPLSVLSRHRIASQAAKLFKMLNKSVQQGRSERRGEAYSVSYVEPLRETRTPLAGFFSILLIEPHMGSQLVVVE